MNCDARSANLKDGAIPCVPELAHRGTKRTEQSLHHAELTREASVRRDERARIARDLHDTLLQGFLGISLHLDAALEQVPAESIGRPPLSQAVLRMHNILNEARTMLQGLRSSAMESTSLEQALSCLREEFTPGGGVQFRVFVTGKPRRLSPETQEQVYLIAREALINALRHSEAAIIETEIEYRTRQLCIRIRDNGCGMDPNVVTSGRHTHWGLVGMRERAACIGARFRIWSRAGAGTEVEISLPSRALAAAQA